MKKRVKIGIIAILLMFCGILLTRFHLNIGEAATNWSGDNVEIYEGGYRFTEWDNKGSANYLRYNEDIGDSNTVSFKFTPSTTGNGCNGGEANLSFAVQTEKQRMRIVLKPYWCAAYIELDGYNLCADNYDPKINHYKNANEWYDVKFAFATGYTELSIDYLGDGLDVFYYSFENIDFKLTNNASVYFSSYGGNSAVKDISLFHEEYHYNKQLWAGTNVTKENDTYIFTEFHNGGSANKLSYLGETLDYNVIRFEFTPSMYNNGYLSDTSNVTFAIQTTEGLLRFKFLPYWSAFYLECNGKNICGENYDPNSSSWCNVNEWFAVELIFGTGYAKVSIDYLCDGYNVFTQELKRFDFVLEGETNMYFTSWGANFALRNIEFDTVQLEKTYMPVDLEFDTIRSINDMSVDNGTLVWESNGFVKAIANEKDMTLKLPDVDNIPGHKYSVYLPLRNTILTRLKNSSPAEKVLVTLKDSNDRTYQKEFDIDPNSDYTTYFFNFSDVGATGYLVKFSYKFININSGDICIDAISFEREAMLYDYAAESLSCIADEENVTVSGQLKSKYANKKVDIYTTSVANNWEKLDHDRNKLVASGYADSTGSFSISFPLVDEENISHLSSLFLASVQSTKLSDAFRIENWRDFVENPYSFTLQNLEVKVTDLQFGAKGDGFTNDNKAIQSAIDYVHSQGGGVVVLPGDSSTIYGRRYIATNLSLKSNVELRIEKGAILWQSPRAKDYGYEFLEGHDAPSTGIMWDHACNHNKPLVLLRNVENVRITGGGIIRMMDWGSEEPDGSTLIGREAKNCNSVIHIAPLFISQSKNVEVSDLQIQRTSNWNITTNRAENLFVGGMYNRDANCCNSDGFGLTNAKNVLLACNFFNGNDDSITVNGVYDDPRKVEDWNKPDVIGDRGTQNVQIMYNQLRGGLGLVFCPWATENPNLARTEIKNIVAYNNRFEGWQNVGSWPDNPFYGLSAGGTFSYSDGEEEDSSPIKDVYFYNNTYYLTNPNIFVFTVSGYHVIADAANVNTDSPLVGIKDFMNPSFEINYRFSGEETWVSGLSYWSMVENGIVNFGTEAVGVKTKTASIDNVTSQMIDYAAYIEGNGKIYQGIYLKEGTYKVTLRTKTTSDNAEIFVGTPIFKTSIFEDEEVEILDSEKIQKSRDFTETTLVFEVAKAGNYALGIYSTGNIDEKVYFDDIEITPFIDVTEPQVIINNPETALAGETIEIDYTAFDEFGNNSKLDIAVSVTKDGEKVELTDNSFVAEIGKYYIRVSATDVTGNTTVEQKTIEVVENENIKPVIEINVPENINPKDKVKIEYNVGNVDVKDLDISISVTRNGEYVDVDDNAFIANEGTYLISLIAQDKYGHVVEVKKELVVNKIVDTIAPTIKINTPTSAITGEEIVVDYIVEDDITSNEYIEVYYYVLKDGVSIVLENNKFVAEKGEYEIVVKAIDKAGNVSIKTSEVNVSDPILDREKPKGCAGNANSSIISLTLISLAAILLSFRKKKKNKSKVIIVLIILLMPITSCNVNNSSVGSLSTETSHEVYSINVLNTEEGIIVASTNEAQKGDIITVDVTPNIGYKAILDSLKVNGSYIKDNRFTMPDKDVNITCDFDVNGDELVEKTSNLNMASMNHVKLAFANIFVEYTLEEVSFEIIVSDEVLLEDDSLELYVCALTSSSTIIYGVNKFTVNSSGTVKLQKFNGASFVGNNEEYLTEFNYFKDDGKLGGYRVKLTVPYETLGLTSTKAVGNMTICPILYNSNVEDSISIARAFNCNENDPSTYVLVKENNKFEVNPYGVTNYQLGFVDSEDINQYWNLENDYSPVDSQYASRYVELKGSNERDNNLCFYRVTGETSYTTMNVQMTDVYKEEKYGKYGLKYVDQAGNGIFFFMDTPGADIDEMSEKCYAGYVMIKKDVFDWDTHVSISANYNPKNDEPLEFSVIRKGNEFEFAIDGNLIQIVSDVNITGTAYPTIVSFNLGLKVTKYSSTDDEKEVESIKFNRAVEKHTFMNTYNGVFWDLANDDGTNGPIYLLGHDTKDNNLYFNKVGTDFIYAKARFKLTDYYNIGDLYMKFGLTLFDGGVNGKSQIMYYVDAWANAPGNTLSTIEGKEFGYSQRLDDIWVYWNKINTKEEFDLINKTVLLEMLYANNTIYFYADGKLLSHLNYKAQSSNLVMGIKNFGLGVEVTDYYCSNDINDTNISEYILTEKATYHFIGSNITFGNGKQSYAENLVYSLNCSHTKQSVMEARLKDYIEMLKKTELKENTETIIFELPISDANSNTPIGAVSSNDTNTIIGALKSIVSYTKANFNCDILFYTVPYCNNEKYEQMIEALYLVSEELSFEVLDYYNYKNMTKLDENTLDEMFDSQFVLNEKGYEWINKVLKIYLRKSYYYKHNEELM